MFIVFMSIFVISEKKIDPLEFFGNKILKKSHFNPCLDPTPTPESGLPIFSPGISPGAAAPLLNPRMSPLVQSRLLPVQPIDLPDYLSIKNPSGSFSIFQASS